ncbi:hypothetical protein [Variovorax sp. J22R115]|uniref:hypothetical protein n=1 Tax=Variovorax sp. J22R115 TaxID=3053509 RepID=UPI002574A8BE|nr:hypothetical protein [Variovorax sp. J22R115]MDM0047720.1 hypothetical protein [Variovorax sp. J22R115]
MNLRFLAAIAIAQFVISGCAGTGSTTRPSAAADAVVIPLKATPINAGKVGRVTVLPLDGNTGVLLYFTGVPWHTTMPVHVYTYIYEAACGALPPQPAYALNEKVLVSSYWVGGPAESLAHTSPLQMNELLSGRYSIALRSAPGDGGQVIFCGELRRT